MDPKVAFFFYLGALVCFGIAAFAGAGPGLSQTGRGVGGRIGLVPLGLGLWLFPTLWATAAGAF